MAGTLDCAILGELTALALGRALGYAAVADRARHGDTCAIITLARRRDRLVVPRLLWDAAQVFARQEGWRPVSDPSRAGYAPRIRVPAVVPLLFIAASLAVVGNQIAAQPAESAIGLLIVMAGLPVYFLWRHYGH